SGDTRSGTGRLVRSHRVGRETPAARARLPALRGRWAAPAPTRGAACGGLPHVDIAATLPDPERGRPHQCGPRPGDLAHARPRPGGATRGARLAPCVRALGPATRQS